MFYPAGKIESHAFRGTDFEGLSGELNDFLEALEDKVIVDVKVGVLLNEAYPAQALVLVCDAVAIDAGDMMAEETGDFPGGFSAPTQPSKEIPVPELKEEE